MAKDREKKGGIKDVFGMRPDKIGYNRVVISAPENIVDPLVTKNGNLFSCSEGTWTGNPEPNFTYQWYRGLNIIGGATNPTYTSGIPDIGAQMNCRVTGTNSEGSDIGQSNFVQN